MKLVYCRRLFIGLVGSFFTLVCLCFSGDEVKGQAAAATNSDGKLLAVLQGFDPKISGFSFRNYGNKDHAYKTDLVTADLIRMFGAKSVCKSGTTAANCVVFASARQWKDEMIDAMDGGHCEGMAVACLRFGLGMPFKGKAAPSDFQESARNPFDLKLDSQMYNYMAYYWTTQTLREPNQFSDATMEKGPVAVVKMLIDGLNAGRDTYTLGIFNLKKGKFVDGHAITPFAVEDAGTYYKIFVYDNNNPGETKFVTVEKGGKQTWRYITAANPEDEEDNYIGDINTKTIGITPTSLREGKCFDAPFAESANTESGCGKETAPIKKPETPVVPKPTTPVTPKTPVPDSVPITIPAKPSGKFIDLSLTGNGDLLVIDSKERKTGYDPELDKVFKQIPGSTVNTNIGGLGVDMPHYRIPYDPNGAEMTIIFSGADIEEESAMDFVYSGPGFTVGFNEIRLDPGEILAAVISPDGKKLSMAMSNDGEMPEVYYSVDNKQKSYRTAIRGNFVGSGGGKKFGSLKDAENGAEADATPELTINFDDDAGKLQILDNSDGDSSYDVDLEQFDSTGKINRIELNDLGAADSGDDNYEIEVGEWDGGDDIKVRHDDEGNGFADDDEEDVDNQDNGLDDIDDSEGMLINSIYNSMGL